METDQKILLALCERLNQAAGDVRELRLLDQLPDYGSVAGRNHHEQNKERHDGLKQALVVAIAETAYAPEEVAQLASGYHYERAAGFVRRSVGWIEAEHRQRQLRDCIAEERGEEFCQYCGLPTDGSYCDMNCLEAHNREAIEASGLSVHDWLIYNMA